MKDRAYEIALNLEYDGYQRGLAIMVCRSFDKKIGSGVTSKVKVNLDEVLASTITHTSYLKIGL